MLRSLNSGVTGLTNHQVRMDVIGNNIANVNTYGYKGKRTTFSENFSQLIKGATNTESRAGGTNPMQIGLGMKVGSIDMLMGQGQLQNTGNLFDMAIEGNAFFGVSDGVGTYYTRNGAFQLDDEGYIVLPTNGMVLQGKMADTLGNFPPGTAIGNLRIPMDQQAPAKATTEVSINRNLNSEGEAKGSVSHTQRLLHPVDVPRAPYANGVNDPGRTDYPKLTSLYNGIGQPLNIAVGDVLQLSYNYTKSLPSGTTNPDQTLSLTVKGYELENGVLPPLGPNEVRDLNDLMLQIQNFLNTNVGLPTGAVANNAVVGLNANGEITISGIGDDAGEPDIYNFTVGNPNSPLSNSGTMWTFLNFGAYLGNGTASDDANGNVVGNEAKSGVLLRPAEQYDILGRIRDNSGQPLNLLDGAAIKITATVGDNDISSKPLIFETPDWLVPGDPSSGLNTGSVPTLLDDLISELRNSLRLPYDFVGKDNFHYPSVGIKTPDLGESAIPEGALTIRGLPGTAFAINNLTITAQNPGGTTITPSNFISVMGIDVKRPAQDAEVVDTSITVYDEAGSPHSLRFQFVHTGKTGEWLWNASFAGKEIITTGTGSGKVIFGLDGTVSSWTFDNGGSTLIASSANGARDMHIKLNVGGPGDWKGITQQDLASSVGAYAQDGYSTGTLNEIRINEFGVIEGGFSNGTSKKIAQIMFVDFANPGGLLGLTDSIFTVSSNSGDPVWGNPTTQSSSKLRPGALEVSNVDLSTEFTNMITTQRGYQANSRVITVSDTLLEELVNLKR